MGSIGLTRFFIYQIRAKRLCDCRFGRFDMKLSLAVIILVIFSTAILAQQSDMQMQMPQPKPVEIYAGLGSLHHPTSTKNPEAQTFFDQGFRMIYGFNHEEAVRSFTRAPALDAQTANACLV